MNQILKFIFFLKGYEIKKAQIELKKIQCYSLNDLKDFQNSKAWEVYDFHYKNNNYYKKWINNKKIKKWKDIPILKKSDLQVSLEKRFSKSYNSKNTYLNNTSGSSGTPFYFAKDKFSHAMTWAVVIDRFGKHGVVFGKSLQARFYGIPISGLKYYKEKLKDLLTSRIRFPVFDLSEKKLKKFQKQLELNKFYYINGYTSALLLFAKFLIKNGTSAKEICPSLQVVCTTSEVCDDTDKKILEKGFGVKVINEYGASELDLIAMEDENGNWILNNETLLIEILDKNGNEVKNGVEGTAVVTSLYNKAMPFIRYELGDRLIKSSKKVGNYEILEKVTGRTNDIIRLPSGKKATGLTFYYISKSLMDNGTDIKEFIIKQMKLDQFIFEYVADKPLTQKQKDKIQQALNEYLEPNLKAFFEQKEVIKRTNSGKLKHFQSYIKK